MMPSANLRHICWKLIHPRAPAFCGRGLDTLTFHPANVWVRFNALSEGERAKVQLFRPLMFFRYHYWNRKLPELVLRTLLTDGAQEVVRFERVAVG